MIYGTKTEIEKHLKWVEPDARLILIEFSEDEQGGVNLHDATPEVRSRALDEIAEMNRGLPVLPDDAFRRENLYEERI